MPNRKEYHCIFACDESWKGFAVCVYMPDGYSFAKTYNICHNKTFQKPLNTLEGLMYWFDEFVSDCPAWHLIDMVIIEGQFRANMKCLQHMLASILRCKLPVLRKILYLSPMAVKRSLNVPLGANHNENKKLMLKRISTSPDLLLFDHCSGDHNLADAIALLNVAAKTYTMSQYQPQQQYPPEVPTQCPKCHQITIVERRVTKVSPNQGRTFKSHSRDFANPTGCKYFEWCEPTLPQQIQPQQQNGLNQLQIQEIQTMINTNLHVLDTKLNQLAEHLNRIEQ